MPDIVTSRVFVDGEKNITAQKLNDIVASSVIQPVFVSAKPPASTVAPTDNLLVLTAAGSYAKAPFQTVIDSVNAALNTNAQIWGVRLRSFQALGNNTFEVDQRTAGTGVVSPATGTFIQDRWQYAKVGTMACSASQTSAAAGINLPGTSFAITRNFLRITLTTAQASLAAGDTLSIAHSVEGPRWRELQNDVHSFQILVRTSVAGLSFGIALRDSPGTKSLTNLLTIPAANTWTLLTLPNLPVWPAGNFVNTSGNTGYILNISLAAGSTFTSPANGTFQNGNFTGATGQSNFAASPVNSTFDIAYISHEPGALCSNPPMDCDFQTNLDACQRYFYKSQSYGILPGFAPTGAGNFQISAFAPPGNLGLAVNWPPFSKPMAKVPTVILWSPAVNNTPNFVYDYTSSAGRAVSTYNVNEKGLSSASLSTAATVAGAWLGAFMSADTGW
jgi:hypothetical protein